MTIKKILPIITLPLILLTCNSTPKIDDRFIVNLSSPNFPAGDIETQIKRTFPLMGIRKIGVAVSYFPYEDAVCLHYRSDFFSYYQFWSRSGRDMFLKALEEYNGEYDRRDIAINTRNSTKKYGNTEGYLSWQMMSFTRRVSANMDIEFGYTFSDRSPYFTVTQKLTTYVDPISEENNMNSQEILMHFTRAQAQELAFLFDQDFLVSLIPPELNIRARINETDIDFDDYFNMTIPDNLYDESEDDTNIDVINDIDIFDDIDTDPDFESEADIDVEFEFDGD